VGVKNPKYGNYGVLHHAKAHEEDLDVKSVARIEGLDSFTGNGKTRIGEGSKQTTDISNNDLDR
jgi:hypothetical protein